MLQLTQDELDRLVAERTELSSVCEAMMARSNGWARTNRGLTETGAFGPLSLSKGEVARTYATPRSSGEPPMFSWIVTLPADVWYTLGRRGARP